MQNITDNIDWNSIVDGVIENFEKSRQYCLNNIINGIDTAKELAKSIKKEYGTDLWKKRN